MTRRRQQRGPKDTPAEAPRPPEPVDVTDGIPDRRPTRPVWPLVVLAAAFLGWLAILLIVHLTGNV